ncbi:MAG: hypothetical protein COA82_09565 [Alkaliphilus sp.]|nr:MAG: hypothetical protein COA82_09565 [Alkaliphilus sp.]
MSGKIGFGLICKFVLITIAVIFVAKIFTGVSGTQFIKFATIIAIGGFVGFYIDSLKKENENLKKELDELK